MWRSHLFPTIIVLFQTCLADTDTNDNADRGLDYGIFAWMNSSDDDGYYNPKQDFRADANGFIGVFANAPISKGEILCRVPWERKIAAADDCGTADLLEVGMRYPEESDFEPYASYLRNQAFNQIPGWWSEEGKGYLERMLDGVLEPERATTLKEEWYQDCTVEFEEEEEDEWWSHAAMQVQARADDDILIPAYDMYNHRNGDWNNAETHWSVITVEDEEDDENEEDEEDDEEEEYEESPHVTTAKRDIAKGEQIYISYNMCPHCGARAKTGYGTPHIFRDYGFVENFPQRWTFMTRQAKDRTGKMEFDLDEDPLGGGKLVLEWRKRPTFVNRAREWLQSEIGRLEKLRDGDEYAEEVPPAELEVIARYREANIVAMAEAVNSLSEEGVRANSGSEEEL